MEGEMDNNIGAESENLSQSLEDYLEAIYLISTNNKIVRVKDVVARMEVKTASVIGALKKLVTKGFIEHERYGYIELTEPGKKKAIKIYEKHSMLLYFINNILGVEKTIAEKDACNIEHFISEQTFEKLMDFVKTYRKQK